MIPSAASVAAPVAAAVVAHRSKTPLLARRAAATGMLVALGASAVVVARSAEGLGYTRVLPLFVSVIGLTAVAMTPLSGLGGATFARMLLTIASAIALVLTRHPIALAILWAASALPVWQELHARAETRKSARAFAIYMLPSVACVGVAGVLSSRGMIAAATAPLALGIAIREAAVPFHSWFPRLFERAPLGVVVCFVAPQLGVYVHLRWLSEGLGPELADAVVALGVVTALFAAIMGVVQTRARRALGYLVLSQTGLVALGLGERSDVGHTGAITSWLVCGLSTAGLAMAVAALEARRGDLSLAAPNGSSRRLPLFATGYLVLGLASVGVPGTLGFVAEDLLVHGSASTPVLALALIVATAINSVTVLRSFFALFTGSQRHAGERDLTLRERAVLTMILAALVFAGLWPKAPLSVLGAPPAQTTTEMHR